MNYLDLKVCAMAKATVTLVGMAYFGANMANVGVLGSNVGHFGVKTTVIDYYVTKEYIGRPMQEDKETDKKRGAQVTFEDTK